MSNVIKSQYVGFARNIHFAVGFGSYSIGIIIHEWGIRIMLIFWHVCFHWDNIFGEKKINFG